MHCVCFRPYSLYVGFSHPPCYLFRFLTFWDTNAFASSLCSLHLMWMMRSSQLKISMGTTPVKVCPSVPRNRFYTDYHHTHRAVTHPTAQPAAHPSLGASTPDYASFSWQLSNFRFSHRFAKSVALPFICSLVTTTTQGLGPDWWLHVSKLVVTHQVCAWCIRLLHKEWVLTPYLSGDTHLFCTCR